MITHRILTQEDYFKALRIRQEVFIEEQNVPPEIEIDEYENLCVHFLTEDNSHPLATGRLRVKDKYIKFERIAVVRDSRGKGIGRALMIFMQSFARDHFPDLTPYMHSQSDAIGFYESLGWKKIGDPFFEAGISHHAMELSL